MSLRTSTASSASYPHFSPASFLSPSAFSAPIAFTSLVGSSILLRAASRRHNKHKYKLPFRLRVSIAAFIPIILAFFHIARVKVGVKDYKMR
ncbi:MAG: hypothetical protein U1F16_10020 [Turneriella sp.]